MEIMIRDRIAVTASLPPIVAPQARAPEAASITVTLSRNGIHAPAGGYARVTYVPSGRKGCNLVITRTLFGVPSTQGVIDRRHCDLRGDQADGPDGHHAEG